MNERPEDQNNQTEHTEHTEAIPQQADDTTVIGSDDTVRMPSAPDTSVAPPAVGALQWAAAVDGAAAVPPAGPTGPVQAAATPAKGKPWWKGRVALAGGALAAGLLLGGAVGATTAVAIGGVDDRVVQVGDGLEGGRRGFDGEGRPPGGRHGGGEGELPGQGQLPGDGTSTDPGEATGTNEAT